MIMKSSNDTMRKRIRKFLACSAVPHRVPSTYVLGLFHGVQRPGSEVQCYPLSSAEDEGEWSCTSTPLYAFTA
jgi:hypothetical protein